MTQRKSYAPPLASLQWAYFLDVDGTLIGFADTPDAVRVEAPLLELIDALHHHTGGALALVSGRMLADLQAHIGLRQLPMAGLHGLERRDSAGRLWMHAAPPAAKQAIQETLAPILARHPGLLLEDKGLTLALHYRRVPTLAGYVHRVMTRVVLAQAPALELQPGKFVVEIKPTGVDKGSAVADYLAEYPFKGRCPVFVGDDLNDEQGFAEVNRQGGISIKVGKGPSCAKYRLPNVGAVHEWLGNAVKGCR